jgi:hypothetical protein
MTRVILVMWPAVTVTVTGRDQVWRAIPLAATRSSRGERSATWYFPAGS